MKKKAFNFCGKVFAVALTGVIAAFSLASCSDDEEEKLPVVKKNKYYNMYFFQNAM